jgi:hypothetical protein
VCPAKLVNTPLSSETNSIIADPLFVAPQKYDFRLCESCASCENWPRQILGASVPFSLLRVSLWLKETWIGRTARRTEKVGPNLTRRCVNDQAVVADT